MNLSKTILGIALLLTGTIAVGATPKQSKTIPSAQFDKIEVGTRICVFYTKGEYSDVKIEYPANISEEKISAYVDADTHTLVVKTDKLKPSPHNIEADTIFVTCSSPELKYLKLGFSSQFHSDSPISSASAMKILTGSSSKMKVPGISAMELNLSAGFSSIQTLGEVSVEKQLTIKSGSSAKIYANSISSKSGYISIGDGFSSIVKIGVLSTPDVCNLDPSSSSTFTFGSISAGRLYLKAEFSSNVTLCDKTSETKIAGAFVADILSSASLMLHGKLSAERIDMTAAFGSHARINKIVATEDFNLNLNKSSKFIAATVAATTLQIIPAFASECKIFSCKVSKFYSRSTSNCSVNVIGLKANIVDIKSSDGSITLSGEADSASIITSETSQVNIDNLKIDKIETIL